GRLAAGDLVRALILLQRGKELALLEELPAFLELGVGVRGALRDERSAGDKGKDERAHARKILLPAGPDRSGDAARRSSVAPVRWKGLRMRGGAKARLMDLRAGHAGVLELIARRRPAVELPVRHSRAVEKPAAELKAGVSGG